MADAERCDPEVWELGKVIAVLDARTVHAEPWVQSVAKRSGQKVDWSYFGGRAVVRYVGDYYAVLRAIDELGPELNGRLLRRYWKDEL